MKRCWFGAALLSVLLVLGLYFSQKMLKDHTAIASALHTAQQSAQAENWEQAETALEQAYDDWKNRWHFTAALADHEPMEEIDSLFAQGQVYLTARDGRELAAICGQLARKVEAMGDAHSLTWWNLL